MVWCRGRQMWSSEGNLKLTFGSWVRRRQPKGCPRIIVCIQKDVEAFESHQTLFSSQHSFLYNVNPFN
jgi:hypothetical protein